MIQADKIIQFSDIAQFQALQLFVELGDAPIEAINIMRRGAQTMPQRDRAFHDAAFRAQLKASPGNGPFHVAGLIVFEAVRWIATYIAKASAANRVVGRADADGQGITVFRYDVSLPRDEALAKAGAPPSGRCRKRDGA